MGRLDMNLRFGGRVITEGVLHARNTGNRAVWWSVMWRRGHRLNLLLLNGGAPRI